MSDAVFRCPAPAKINLFLHVTGRREDGYHLLQSAFRLLDWCDWLEFAVRDDGVVRRVTSVPGVPAEQDLIVRAARLLQQHCGISCGVDIGVEKNLPMGGGLGGGSSDAATTLLALNALWRCGLNEQTLMRLGLQLGADVPFFIFGRDAFVEGIGEKLQPLPLPAAWYVVVEPGVHVSTAEIFSSEVLTRNTIPIKVADFAASTTRNDLQAVVEGLQPEVNRVVRWLNDRYPARMTGSGACVFAEVPGEEVACGLVAECPSEWRARAVRSLQVHPLRRLIGLDQL